MTEEFERYKAAQAARWLEHIAQLGTRCDTLRAAVEQQRSLAEGVQAVCYDGMPHAASSGDALPNAVARLHEAIEAHDTELAGYVAERQDAHERLSKLENAMHSACLERHYLMGQPWERVCVDMSYAWQGMMGLRRKALAEAFDVMPLEWRDPMHPAV